MPSSRPRRRAGARWCCKPVWLGRNSVGQGTRGIVMGIGRCAAALAAGLVVGLSPAAFSGAQAQDYPSRPITLLLPLGAGGAMDILARSQFEPKLHAALGKPIIIENRTGGGTVVAAV